MRAPDTIRFSVVIPAWNAAGTLAGALQSCLDQSHAPYEVIVVDDGSTDATPDLLRSFGDRIRIVVTDNNRGPSHARNAGMDLATGDFIAFLDADDVWHPDKLRLVARALSADDRIRFLFHAYTLGPMGTAVPGACEPRRYPFFGLLLRNPVATPCAVLVNDGRRRFNEQMRHMEDYALFLKAAADCGLYFLDLPLTRLGRPVLSEGGQSADRWAMRKGEFAAWLQLAWYQPVYFPLLPFLFLWGLSKHGFKLLRTAR